MYNYVLNKENSNLIVMLGEQRLAEMNLIFNDDKVCLDMIDFSDDLLVKISSIPEYINFISKITKDIVTELSRIGIKVNKAIIGKFLKVHEYENKLNISTKLNSSRR